MLKIFTLKYEEISETFNDGILSNILSDKEILQWESHFFDRKNEYFWTILVEYRTIIPSQTNTIHKSGKTKDESYKKILTKKFPKKVRFTFTTRIDNLALDILEDILSRVTGEKIGICVFSTKSGQQWIPIKLYQSQFPIV